METLDNLARFLNAWWEWSGLRSAWRAGALVCLADECGPLPLVVSSRPHRRSIELAHLLGLLADRDRVDINGESWRVMSGGRHANAAQWRIVKPGEPVPPGGAWHRLQETLPVSRMLARWDVLRPLSLRPWLPLESCAPFYLWARERYRLVRMPLGPRAARVVPMPNGAGFIAPSTESGRVVVALAWNTRPVEGTQPMRVNGKTGPERYLMVRTSRSASEPLRHEVQPLLSWLDAVGVEGVPWIASNLWRAWTLPLVALVDAADRLGELLGDYEPEAPLRRRPEPRAGWVVPEYDPWRELELRARFPWRFKPRVPTTLEHELRVGARVVGQLRGIA